MVKHSFHLYFRSSHHLYSIKVKEIFEKDSIKNYERKITTIEILGYKHHFQYYQ